MPSLDVDPIAFRSAEDEGGCFGGRDDAVHDATEAQRLAAVLLWIGAEVGQFHSFRRNRADPGHAEQ